MASPDLAPLSLARLGLALLSLAPLGWGWLGSAWLYGARLGSAKPWFAQRGPAWLGKAVVRPTRLDLAWLRFALPTWLGLLSFSTKEGSELILTAVRLRHCAVLHRRVVLFYGVVKLLCFTQLLSSDLSWWRNDVVLFATIFHGRGTTSSCLR